MTYHINLFDPTLKRQKQWLTAANLLFAAAMLALALLGWGAWLRVQGGGLAAQAADLDSRTQAARQETIALGAQLANRRPDAKLALDLAAIRELLGVREGILEALGQGTAPTQTAYADYLRGLARQSVSGLWLTGFSVGADGQRMEIRGRTLDPALLPQYIGRLNAEPAFRGHRFSALTLAVPVPARPAGQASPDMQAAPPPAYHEFALVPDPEAPPRGNR